MSKKDLLEGRLFSASQSFLKTFWFKFLEKSWPTKCTSFWYIGLHVCQFDIRSVQINRYLSFSGAKDIGRRPIERTRLSNCAKTTSPLSSSGLGGALGT